MIEVTAAILFQDEKVLIARRKPGIKHAGKWEFPGGKVEAGETPEECLVRELKEELGIAVRIKRFFAENVHQYRRGPVRILSYRTEWICGEMVPRDHDQLNWVKPIELMVYDLLPADIPFARMLIQETASKQ
jgi:8-oxo-dGTP diphosphatase